MTLVTTGQFTITDVNDALFVPNILKWYEQWNIGSSLITGWTIYGDAAENVRASLVDPFGFKSTIWRCVPDADGGASGGFTVVPEPIDPAKLYRYTCFVKRVGDGVGTIEHGCGGVKTMAGDTVTTGIFCESNELNIGEWYLLVGFIHPESETTPINKSGIYTMNGRLLNPTNEYKFNSAVTPTFFTRLTGGVNAVSEYQLFNPTFECINGTEESIADLVHYDASEFDYLTEVLKHGETTIEGGLLTTNLIQAAGMDKVVRSGMSGLAGDNIGFWTGGSYHDALSEKASNIIHKDGSIRLGGGALTYDKADNKFALGDFRILNGEIIGLDSNSKERVRMSRSALPDIGSISQGWAYFSEGIIGGHPAMIVGDEVDHLPSDKWVFANSVGTLDVYKPFTLEKTIVVAAPSQLRLEDVQMEAWIYNVDPEASTITATWGIYNASTGAIVYPSGGPVSTSTPINIGAAGTYKLKVNLNPRITNGEPESLDPNQQVFFEASFRCSAISFQGIHARSMIGQDGIMSWFSATSYLYYKESYGFEARFGSMGIRITSQGIEKMINGVSWTADTVTNEGTITATTFNNHVSSELHLTQAQRDVLAMMSVVSGELKVTGNIYATGSVSALGIGVGGGGTAYDRLDTWASYDSGKAGWVLSAALGYDLHGRVSTLESSTPNIAWGVAGSGYIPLAVNGASYQLSTHGHTHTKSSITDFAHTHDDRYYTETEVNTLLANSSNWDTAYSWGNHASAGYAANSSLSSHTGNTSNPHAVTSSQVGLGNVENTALSTWAGSGNITALGTVTSGTWDANTIAVTKGGTGKTSVAANSMLYATGANVYGEVTTTAFGRGLLSAASGTVVGGLNADLLDGLHSYQQRRFNNASGIDGGNAVAFGYASYAGIRTGDATYPYAYIETFSTLAITHNGSTVYGILCDGGSGATYSYVYGGTTYSYTHSASVDYALVLIDDALFCGSGSHPFNKANLLCDGLIWGNGNRIVSATNITGNVWQVLVYSWTGSMNRTFNSYARLYAYKKAASSDYSGNYSVASGNSSVASGSYSVASGYYSVASGNSSVASGYSSVASGNSSVASGSYSVASGYSSVASGSYSVASHDYSVDTALYGITGARSQTVLGKYNAQTTDALILGWGSSASARANIFSVSTSGQGIFASTVSATTAILSNLTVNKIPYHTAAGLTDSPMTVSGSDITTAGNLSLSSADGTFMQIGSGRLVWDNTNNAIKVIKSDGTAANFYATGSNSAQGIGTGGGGASYDMVSDWSQYVAGSELWVVSAELINALRTSVTGHIGDSTHASAGEKSNWNAAYSHSVVTGGVHMTSTDRSQLTTAYNHSQAAHQTIINGTGFVKASGTTLSYDNNSYSLSSHVHGNVTNDGKIGSVASLVVVTGTGGLLTAKTAGTTSQYLRGDGSWATPPDTIYTHPTTAGNKHIPSGGASGQILRWSADGTAAWGADNDTIYTHPNSGVTAGTYRSVTVNVAGHVTGGTNPTTLSGYGITDAIFKEQVTVAQTDDTWVKAYANPKAIVYNTSGIEWGYIFNLRDDKHYGSVLSTSYKNNTLRMLTKNTGTWGSWVTFISSENIGSQSVSHATTATKLETTRALTIGNTAKNFDGSAAVSWSLAEIGAMSASATTDSVNEGTTNYYFTASRVLGVNLSTVTPANTALAANIPISTAMNRIQGQINARALLAGASTQDFSVKNLTVAGTVTATDAIKGSRLYSGYNYTAQTGGFGFGTDGLANGAIFYTGADTSGRIYRDSNVMYFVRGTSATAGFSMNSIGAVTFNQAVETKGLLTATGNIKTANADGAYVQIGPIKILYDATNNALRFEGNVYATGSNTAFGVGGGAGGGGLITNVYGSAGFGGTYSDVDLSSTFNAYAINSLYTAIQGKQNTITGAISTLVSSNLYANYALVSGATGKIQASGVTATELSYLSGVSSNIQTQINAKPSVNSYPTAFSWNAGTTSGPTATISGSNMTAISVAAIPEASATASGIVTTGSQTFAGEKWFVSSVWLAGANAITLDGATQHIYSHEQGEAIMTFDNGQSKVVHHWASTFEYGIAGSLDIKMGTALTFGLDAMPSGAIRFANGADGNQFPSIVGKSASVSTGTGLFLAAGSTDTNTTSDMLFSVRRHDNADFTDISKVAFRWSRYATNLMTLGRNGLFTLMPATNSLQGASQAAYTHAFSLNAANIPTYSTRRTDSGMGMIIMSMTADNNTAGADMMFNVRNATNADYSSSYRTQVAFRWDRYGAELFAIQRNGVLRKGAMDTAPVSPTAAGVMGEIRFTSTGLFICIATNTWRKATISTF